jgi:hypothetical protein
LLGPPVSAGVSRHRMSEPPKWARYLGIAAAAAASLGVAFGFTSYMCLGSGGHLADFGTSCQMTACPDFLVVGYLSPWMAVPIIVFVALPVYLTVSAYSPHWFRAKGKT